jgi:hypothetical protein
MQFEVGQIYCRTRFDNVIIRFKIANIDNDIVVVIYPPSGGEITYRKQELRDVIRWNGYILETELIKALS